MRKHLTDRRKEFREWIIEIKRESGCSRCPESDPVCLDFHHLDPDKKEATLSHIVGRGSWSKEHVQREIEKCIILCANCHRKEHGGSAIRSSSLPAKEVRARVR